MNSPDESNAKRNEVPGSEGLPHENPGQYASLSGQAPASDQQSPPPPPPPPDAAPQGVHPAGSTAGVGDSWNAGASDHPDSTRQTSGSSPSLLPESFESLLTNPALPSTANWICIYAIVVAPVLWVIGNMSCVMTDMTFHNESRFFGVELGVMLLNFVVSLAITIVWVFGGIRLRAMRRIGPTLIKIGFWAEVGWFVLYMMLSLPMMAIAEEADMAESTPGGTVVAFLLLCLGICAFAFEVVAVIWLYRFGDRLPLNNGAAGQSSQKVSLYD